MVRGPYSGSPLTVNDLRFTTKPQNTKNTLAFFSWGLGVFVVKIGT
jgi:hypothetical protein